VGTGVGVGICVDKKAVHGYMHPEAGHCFVPLADEDLKSNFKGVCPFHGGCIEGMVASHAIAKRSGIDRRELAKIPDESPVWDSVAHYLAYLCVNLTLTVSPDVIVVGGGISKRSLIFNKIHEKVGKYFRFFCIIL
jgi:fructokinase